MKSDNQDSYNRVKLYLENRFKFDEYAYKIIGENVGFWGDLYRNYGDEMKNHATALLIARMEKGFKNKDYEDGYRSGLGEVMKLYAECKALIDNQSRIQEKKNKINKIKKLY